MLDQKTQNNKNVAFYEQLQPTELMIYLLLGSSAVLFSVLIVINVFSTAVDTSKFSLYFIMSTMVLLFSSKYSFRIKHLYNEENWSAIRNSVLILTLSGMAFIMLQYFGWIEMKNNGSFSRINELFYILCGLHILHIVVMVVYSGKVFRKYLKMSLDPIYALLIQANPFEIRKIRLLSQCWLYLDVIWMMILLSFIL